MGAQTSDIACSVVKRVIISVVNIALLYNDGSYSLCFTTDVIGCYCRFSHILRLLLPVHCNLFSLNTCCNSLFII